MTSKRSLRYQLDYILDLTSAQQVEVIVQMESKRTNLTYSLKRAASIALSRRGLSLSPRDLLPGEFGKHVLSQDTASLRALLGRATEETMALARLQKRGSDPFKPLLSADLVRNAIGRMLPQGKARPEQFWTSRSMPLRLKRDELSKLPDAVQGIQSIHINRRLGLPTTVETQAFPLGAHEVRAASWGIERIKALAVWGAYEARGRGITIGLLDTGVDATHPDLAGKIAHWAEFDSLGNIVPGSKPHDTDRHGTHCAGTLVGGRASGRAIGVAPQAKVAAALVIGGDKGGTDAQVLAGIDWAVERKVHVLSLSLGGLVMDAKTPPTYTEAILTCIEAGIPVVVAIGNEGGQTTGSPGSDLFALSVGATDFRDRVAGFSGGRTQVIYDSDYIEKSCLPLAYSKPELTAPGVAIYSSVPGGKWKSLSGTSMATPHVAGAIALLLSATSIRKKERGAPRSYLLQDLITGSVEDLGESGQDHRFGFGRLDVLRAVDFACERGYGP